MQFPECSLPFLGGHHSLVMFALMSYMLISHGPSPPLQMGLWGDIPSHPLAGKDQVVPRKPAAAVPACLCILLCFSGTVPVKWDLPGAFTGFQLYCTPGCSYTPTESFNESIVTY